MWPFKESAEGAATRAAAREESDRLAGLPVSDLAAEVMNALGPDGLRTKSGHQQGAIQVATWLLSDFSGKSTYTQPVFGPTIEALEVLVSADLVQSRGFGSGKAKTYHATRAGLAALAAGTVRDFLD